MIWVKRILVFVLTVLIAAICLNITVSLATDVALASGDANSYKQAESIDAAIMDHYDMFITHHTSNALDGVLEIKKVYWLSDDQTVPPKPNREKFGMTDDPSTLAWLLDEAAELLDGQQTLFNTNIDIAPGSQVRYYLDETILAITWKQGVDGSMYTVSEVKVGHPSQFRRFLTGNEYGSTIRNTTSAMAASVNAVVASSGDFYAFRQMGVIVYDGVVRRTDPQRVDTCYIDENGNMIFSYRGELATIKEAQAFVDENNIRFSLAFGPALIADGELCSYDGYSLGEAFENYARAGLGQLGDLHYILVAANNERPYGRSVTIAEFQQAMAGFGCRYAYTLDGGQTAVIVHDGEVINKVVYGYQRNVSDIIYFATAMPEWD
jgi:exopolysaccharide biosynthesis protein